MSDNKNDVNLDQFDDLEKLVNEDDEGGILSDFDSGEKMEETGVNEFVDEDLTGDEHSDEFSDEPGSEDQYGTEDIIDEEEEDDDNIAHPSDGVNKKGMIAIAGMGVVFAGVVGFVGYDTLKSAGIIGQENVPPESGNDSVASGFEGLDGAPMASEGAAAIKDSGSSDSFESLLESTEAPKSTALSATSEEIPSSNTTATMENGKVSVEFIEQLKAKKKAASTAEKVETPDKVTSKVDFGVVAESSAKAPDVDDSPVPDPNAVEAYDSNVQSGDFNTTDFSYMRMESMLDSYAEEAGFIDNKKLKQELGVVRNQLSERIDSVQKDVDGIKVKISALSDKDVEHDKKIASLEKRISELNAAPSKPELPEITDRTRLKGFKVITSSSDGKMVTAKTPSGKVQVFFVGEKLFVRGQGMLEVREIEGVGQRVLVGGKYYFDDVHIDVPKPVVKKSEPASAEKTNQADKKASAQQTTKSIEDAPKSDPGYVIAERNPALEVKPKTSKRKESYVISEKSPEKIAHEVKTFGESVSYSRNVAKGWSRAGGDSNGSTFLIKDPQAEWHVVRVGDNVAGLGKVRGIDGSGNLAVGNFVIVNSDD